MAQAAAAGSSSVAFSVADDPVAVREKKAALSEVIELQRVYIESRGASASDENDENGNNGQRWVGEDEEMRWYTEQAKRLEKLKAALNAVRLQPDEFPLLVPRQWAARGGDAADAHPWEARELVPYILRINARSQLTFVPSSQPPGSARPSAATSSTPPSTAAADDADADAAAAVVPTDEPPSLGRSSSCSSASTAAEPPGGGASVGGCVPRVFFMDHLKQVRLAAAAAPTLDVSDHLPPSPSPSSAASAVGSPPPAAAVAPPRPRAVHIELAGGAPLVCITPEAAELVEVLGAHLRRYNASRVALARSLQGMHALKATAYDDADPSHEELLRRLWACGFGGGGGGGGGGEGKLVAGKPPGGGAFQRTSPRWLHLGFQTEDPAKDFRGMGLLGLSNLVYFGEAYPDVFSRLVAAQRKRDYPLACAGINVTSMLIDLLRMRDEAAAPPRRRRRRRRRRGAGPCRTARRRALRGRRGRRRAAAL